MPPGCGRVVITQRSIGLTTSRIAVPRAMRRPTSASSAPTPSVSTRTLPRKRRRSHTPIEPVPRTETRVAPESWNVPSGPSHSNHGEPASSSKSAAISKRPVMPAPARRSSTSRPSQAERASSSPATVPSGRAISTSGAAGSPMRRAAPYEQLRHPPGRQGEAGLAVDERPLAVADDAEVTDRGRLELLALHRLHRVAPQTDDVHRAILAAPAAGNVTTSPRRLHAGATPDRAPWCHERHLRHVRAHRHQRLHGRPPRHPQRRLRHRQRRRDAARRRPRPHGRLRALLDRPRQRDPQPPRGRGHDLLPGPARAGARDGRGARPAGRRAPPPRPPDGGVPGGHRGASSPAPPRTTPPAPCTASPT